MAAIPKTLKYLNSFLQVPDLHKPVNLPLKEVSMPTRPEPFELQVSQSVTQLQ